MRNVIVTGGSKGLGLEIAHRLAAEGYRVIAVARNRSSQLASAIEQAPPESLEFLSFDLSDIAKIPDLVKGIHKQFGTIYGLVNNAGVGPDGALAMMDNAKIEHVVRLNTLSPIMLSKYVVRRMMADGGGRIVNVASITAFTGYSGLSVYSATKASIVGFTRSLAREVGRAGVNVNAVAPGFMQTEMTQGMDEEFHAQMLRRSALKRLSTVEDVAGAVEFLLGEKAKNITGTVLTVDAGATA